MLSLVALVSFLVGDAPSVAAPAAPVRPEYEAVRGRAGRSADDQVRLALWCEAHGLSVERIQHLSRAVLADPTNTVARGLLGLVARDGRWLRPEVVARRQADDPDRAALLAEYNRRRATTPYTADGQFALGSWADERGLKDQARAHYTATTRLDPAKEVAWKRLGYKKHDGRWRTDAQVAADRADAEAQKTADRRWKPLLEKWRGMLARPAQRAEAEANLQGVTDPRAVPSIAQVFGGSEADHGRAAQLLGQIDSAEASRGLASLAAFSPSSEARRVATETLRGRDAREYADLLIALICDRIIYQVVPVAGPGSPGVLLIEGKRANVKRLYSPPVPQLQPGDRLDYDPQYGEVVRRGVGPTFAMPWVSSAALGGLATPYTPASSSPAAQQQIRRDLTATLSRQGPGAEGRMIADRLADAALRGTVRSPFEGAVSQVYANTGLSWSNTAFQVNLQNQVNYSVDQLRSEAQRAAAVAQAQMTNDKKLLDQINDEVARNNDRAVGILRTATGQAIIGEREPWEKWWVDLIGYRFNQAASNDKPTLVEQVPLGFDSQVQPISSQLGAASFRRMSCFGAGTPVQTMAGPRAIETLAVGDLVLTQSTATGALGYQPILRVHHNPPGSTFRIRVGGDEVVSSDFHRFWVAGRGWVMARNLRAGDLLRTLGGVVSVDAVDAGKTEPVFNLDVAEDADFFAGTVAALVHDNTLPDPRLVPFDRVVVAGH